MKRFIIIILILLFSASYSFAGQKMMSLTTYIHDPSAEFEHLNVKDVVQLKPGPKPIDCIAGGSSEDAGYLFVLDDPSNPAADGRIHYCDNVQDGWQLIETAGSESPWGLIDSHADKIIVYSKDDAGYGWPFIGINTNEAVPPTGTNDEIPFKLTMRSSGILLAGAQTDLDSLDLAQGSVFLWESRLGAFRAGYTDDTSWDWVSEERENVGQYSTAFGYGTEASGNSSFASGHQTKAAGDYSFASGYETTASGEASAAFGSQTMAQRDYSTAMGYSTNAAGKISAAFGVKTKAFDFASTAMGSCNEFFFSTGHPDDWTHGNAVFMIGNGRYDNNTAYDCDERSNAWSLFNDGRLAMNSESPLFDLTIGRGEAVPDGGIIALGSNTFGNGRSFAGDTRIEGREGAKFIWYPRKAAFRAGFVNNDGGPNEWNDSNIGDYSVAFGWGTLAIAEHSAVLGGYANKNEATGEYSTIVGGKQNEAEGSYSTVGGLGNLGYSFSSTAFGRCNDFAGVSDSKVSIDPLGHLFTIGNGSATSFTPADPLSYSCESGGTRSNALTILQNGKVGIGTVDMTADAGLHVVGDKLMVGDTQAGIVFSNTSGMDFALNLNDNRLKIISYANDYPMSPEEVFDLDIVNGRSGFGIEPQPGYEVSVNGNLYVFDELKVTGDINSISDMRFKKDIKTIDNALERIGQVRGVNYKWKDRERGEDLQLGVIAQEVEKVFPELVNTRRDGYKGVYYENMIGALIEAVKELDDEHKALEAIYEENNKVLEELEIKINKL